MQINALLSCYVDPPHMGPALFDEYEGLPRDFHVIERKDSLAMLKHKHRSTRNDFSPENTSFFSLKDG